MNATSSQLGTYEMSVDTIQTRSLPIRSWPTIGRQIAAWLLASGGLALASSPAMAFTPSQYPLFIGSVTKANVLLIMDNSNSMDETPSGLVAGCDAFGCGSASELSKSQMARTAAKNLITSYTNKINLGLMAYQQQSPTAVNNPLSLTCVNQGFYDVSYDPSNFDSTFDLSLNPLNSLTKKYFVDIQNGATNPASIVNCTTSVPIPGVTTTTYYNLPLPVYGPNRGTVFGYSPTANAFGDVSADTYRFFNSKANALDTLPVWRNVIDETAKGYQAYRLENAFEPTDSDKAEGVFDFGKRFAWYPVAPAWFTSQSPGLGYLHVPIKVLDATTTNPSQVAKINTKLDRSQFDSAKNGPTNAALPLQNAGNTPIKGTLQTAKIYFQNPASLDPAQGGAQDPLPDSCGQNFAVLVTDGLPSTNEIGATYTSSATALGEAAQAASDLRTTTGVETYVVGFSLPSYADPTALDTLANAGGTATAYSATDPTSLNTVLGTIFSNILAKTGSAASVATNSTNLQTESRVFQAKFSSADWSGQLLQFKLNDLNNPEWDSGSKINAQAANSRVVITKGATDGVPFRWADLTATQQTALNAADGLGSDRVPYLRGDASKEGTVAGKFRARTVSKLGDIVNSNPWYLGPPAAGYSDVDYPGYNAFRNGALGRKPVVYVGSNDGMLHGFDASLVFGVGHSAAGDPTGTAGNEVLAYVPSAVYPNLSQLTSLIYNEDANHRYFVDGSPMAADAYLTFPSGISKWSSILVGSLGGGGKGYYALDVTSPGSFSEAGTTPADILLWEFTENDDADVGFAYNNPPAHSHNGQAKQVVKMANGKWAVILGNGYSSTPGKAALYILFINGGIDGVWTPIDASGVGDYVKITADVPVALDNGLSTPVPFDSNGDGYVDTVYAGDLKGNMWKFLVGPNAADGTVTSDASTWKVALSTAGCGAASCTPLFSATDSTGTAQPITWPPEVSQHPSSGQMVLFGTGKYLESGDNVAAIGTQTFYGIHDDGAAVSGRDALSPVEITIPVGSTFRTSAAPSVCGPLTTPPCPASPKGWYADMPTAGERGTGIPKIDSGTIFFNTFIPIDSVAYPCSSGGTGWLMALDYLTGTTPLYAIFDTNGDGVIDGLDTLVSGAQIGAALGGTTLIKSDLPGGDGAGVSSLVTGELKTDKLKLGVGTRGRVFWREIVQ